MSVAERVAAYVDGFKLYFGLKSSGWQRYWLNVQQLASNLLKPGQTLVATKCFTSLVSDPPDKQKRQTTFLEALQTLIDPPRRRAEFHQPGPDGYYRLMDVRPDGRFESAVLPSFWLKVEWLWQRPLPKLPQVLKEWGQ